MIKLSAHAHEAIENCEIAIDWIATTVANPDFTSTDRRDPALTHSCHAIPEFGNRILRVIHRPQGDDIVIVTAFFDRGAKP